MKTSVYFLSVLMLTTLSTTQYCIASAAVREKADASGTMVQRLIADYDKPESPGGVVMVMRDGAVVYSHAFGMANLEHGIRFDAETPTNIGSTSKQFTAFAIALLEERGFLSVHDDVRKYIPELPELGDTVRLWHLLSHSSGYREYLNSIAMSGRGLNDLIRREEIIPLVQRQPALQNTPGDSYNYNNTGYALLAMVVERITEEEFPVWMKANVFEPLGMHHTQVRKHPGQVIKACAQGYSVDAENKATAVNDLYASMGAGGMYTTVVDLAKWIGNFYEPVLGSPELIQKLQTPFKLNNGETANYGYGLMVGEMNGLKMVQHGGADAAHRSNLIMFPTVQGAVITQSNHSGFPNQIAAKVAEAFFADVMDIEEKEGPTEQDLFIYEPEKFDAIAGRYELEVAPGFILEFSREGDKLYTQATGQPKVELFASSDSTFYLKVVEASVTFHRDENGEVNSMTLHQNGHHKANRLTEPAWIPSDDDLKMYLGRYFSEELEAFYTVALDDESNMVLQHRRLSDIPLKAEEKDVYTGGFPIMGLKFIRNEEGVVTGFEASSGRSFGIVFEKQ